MTEHATGTHVFTPDPRNDNVLIDVNGELFPRPEAKVSVFDSGFMLGDGVWEGLRVYGGSDYAVTADRGDYRTMAPNANESL